MKHTALTVAALTTCFAAVCRAASPPAPVPANLLACSRVQDPTERVKCYDSQIEAMKSQAGSVPAPVATTTAPASPTNGRRAVAAPNQTAVDASAAAANTPAPTASASAAATTTAPAAITNTSSAAGAPAAVPASPGNSATASPAGPATAAAAPQSTDAQFGRELLPPTARPATSERDNTLLSNITAMQQVHPKTFLISLANGQVWRQEGTQITSFIRVGEDAHIERGAMGSYHLWTDEIGAKNWVSVTRVR